MRRCPRMWRHLACAVAALGMMLPGPPRSRAEEVKVEHLGLDLVGNLERAGRDLAGSPAVVLIVHDALGFHGAPGPQALQAALAARQLPSLAITLSLGIEARRRPFDCAFDHDHRDADAAQEIAAWTQWLAAQGAKSVMLAGEGTGALQVAIRSENADGAATPDTPTVRGLVLINPAPSDPEARAGAYRARFAADLGIVLAEATRVATEAGEDTALEVPGFLQCDRAKVTAGAFLDAYDPARAPDLVALLGGRKIPLLALLAEGDGRRGALSASRGGDETFRLEKLSTEAGRGGPLAAPETADAIAGFAGSLRP